MKKIISILLTAVMLVGALAVSASADGTMYVQSDFSDMSVFTQHFHAGAFFTEGGDGVLYGYNEAKCLQTIGEWYVYDTAIKVCLADDDMSDAERGFSLWYCNTNLENYGRYDGTNYMKFGYNIDEGYFYLGCGNLDGDGTVELVDHKPYELEDETDQVFGISIDRQRIRCFINDELVFDYYDDADDYLIGLEDENTIPVPHVYWNDGNYIQVKDVKISSPGYLFPYASADEGTSVPADTDAPTGGNDTPANTDAPADTPADPEKDAPADNDAPAGGNDAPAGDNGNADNNAPAGNSGNAGNTPVQPADTNQNKPAGGNATATGDATFAVACAMVITLGCALIVRKIGVR